MRMLIAEDEPLEAEALRTRLERLGHAVVAVVYDGEQAVAEAARLRPDLVFLDLRMPKLDGITAAEKIVTDRRVPIIVLTAQADAHLQARALKTWAVVWLVKPVDEKQLRKAISLVLNRATGVD